LNAIREVEKIAPKRYWEVLKSMTQDEKPVGWVNVIAGLIPKDPDEERFEEITRIGLASAEQRATALIRAMEQNEESSVEKKEDK
jgi:hypothetical protein